MMPLNHLEPLRPGASSRANVGQASSHLGARRRVIAAGVALLGATLLDASPVWAADEAADAFVRRLSSELLEVVKSDRSLKTGDVQRIATVVDARIMPHLNFRRMTASAVGPAWRQATPEQQARLQDEFKALLIRTYAGALSQVKEQTIQVKPLRAAPATARARERGRCLVCR